MQGIIQTLEESKEHEGKEDHQIITESCKKMVENILSLEIFKTF